MKKVLAIALALVLALGALTGCGANNGGQEASNNASQETSKQEQGEKSSSANVSVAMITDYGDITDQSFNQTTYEACKAFCENAGIEFNYFKPGSNSDEDRISMIEAAIDQGYNVIVMPGYAFAPAIVATVEEYPDVTFIALDVSEYDLQSAKGTEKDFSWKYPSNLYSAVYQEELCGYMAGYAAVKLGYTKLGFLGGMAVPAVIRYGLGFVQGADAAAVELNLSDVEIKYAYGNQFYGDADITAAMDTWYADGTQVVFACGGGIFSSAGEAAAKVGGKVIGVDVDQAATIDSLYGEGMTVTSAMKGLAATVKTMLQVVVDGKFADYGGKVENLGLVSETPSENYVQIAPSTQFADGFTEADYNELVAKMFKGEITVSNETSGSAADFATVVTVIDQGNIK